MTIIDGLKSYLQYLLNGYLQHKGTNMKENKFIEKVMNTEELFFTKVF